MLQSKSGILRAVWVILLAGATFLGCAMQIDNMRRAAYVKDNQRVSKQIKNAILNGFIVIGMTTDQVRASWGKPHDVNRTVGSWGVHEQWVYGHEEYYGAGVSGFTGDYYLYFENDLLTSWQD